ncbi:MULTISPECIES: hypothetical protein [unclassified Nostoc]|nr:hypothetical protein [Nostoc sp. JL33]MBN3869685.1 hypothetical protein [Nostoc sp. JL33]
MKITKKLKNPSSFISKISNVFSANDRYQMNRDETLKFQPFDLLEKTG